MQGTCCDNFTLSPPRQTMPHKQTDRYTIKEIDIQYEHYQGIRNSGKEKLFKKMISYPDLC